MGGKGEGGMGGSSSGEGLLYPVSRDPSPPCSERWNHDKTERSKLCSYLPVDMSILPIPSYSFSVAHATHT